MFTNQVIVTGGNTMHVEVFSLKDTHPAVFDPVTRDEASTLAAGVPASLDKLPPELNRNRRSLLRAYIEILPLSALRGVTLRLFTRKN